MRKLYLKPTPLLVLPSNPAMRFKTIALVCAAAVAALSGTERLHAANGTSPARGTDHTVAATPLPPGATAIQIDGELNEAIWQKAPIISGFVQRRPAEGAAPSYATEARVVFETWRRHYSHVRPHTALDWLAPAEFARRCGLEPAAAELTEPENSNSERF